ncbi:disulfide bond formation protein DsbA [Streptomyces solincola]|uniref:Disulfide bond formation protein DsbA n=1 Tax=Streptomyces solincola TaxID=2100817 RepID=A0A2S9PVK3_9ACTN|nr:thioredoxin domain-containing protein [Streptomyces solincola]PRH78438.1 disulfide bond formation protein DsbA [Streptomyces solincola]
MQSRRVSQASDEVSRIRKRRAVVAAVAAVLLGTAAVVGSLLSGDDSPPRWKEAAGRPVTAPRHTSGPDGTRVLLGRPSASHTLQVYEDPRCPGCALVERVIGADVRKDVRRGKYRLQYVGATFLDGDSLDGDRVRTGAFGEGSKAALSALGAALDTGEEAFLAYKDALYSARFHPDERDDRFGDEDYLLEVADSVPALRGNAAFHQAVRDRTYDAWALAMARAFQQSGTTATPKLVLDGQDLTTADGGSLPLSAEQYREAVDRRLAAR